MRPDRPTLPAAASLGFLILLLAGCWPTDPVREARYGNPRALASRLDQPTEGSADERTYLAPRYREQDFGTVRIAPVQLRAPEYDDADHRAFRERLRKVLVGSCAAALTESERFAGVYPEGAPAGAAEPELLCRIEALAHVVPLGHPVGRDPITGDPRQKLFVVYTITERGSGEVVFKYTSWSISHWEYGPWAMDDLVSRAGQIAGELVEALQED